MKDRSWRVQSSDDGSFDELVIRIAGKVIHLEMMSDDSLFMTIPGFGFWVSATKGGVTVNGESRPEHGVEVGEIWGWEKNAALVDPAFSYGASKDGLSGAQRKKPLPKPSLAKKPKLRKKAKT